MAAKKEAYSACTSESIESDSYYHTKSSTSYLVKSGKILEFPVSSSNFTKFDS